MDLMERPRRLRAHSSVRSLVGETQLGLAQLIQPYFLTPEPVESSPIAGFSNVVRWGTDAFVRRVEMDLERGLKHFVLFGAARSKDSLGSDALSPESAVVLAIRRLRKELGAAPVLYTDVCLCPYTDHGHCGVWKAGQVDNDQTVALLSQMAVLHAEAGADFVSPSDMMDGRVVAIRQALDAKGHTSTGVLAYTAKYASNYYGPFRQALDCAPEAGSDRSGYQMDFRNRKEALRELRLDTHEGADMVMVKPALAYLDIISDFARTTDLPVLAYSVSGEYQMVKLMAREGVADERKLALENLFAIRRAGASGIITYFASQAAEEGWLK
jgi:porphobilinogen synthase